MARAGPDLPGRKHRRTLCKTAAIWRAMRQNADPTSHVAEIDYSPTLRHPHDNTAYSVLPFGRRGWMGKRKRWYRVGSRDFAQ